MIKPIPQKYIKLNWKPIQSHPQKKNKRHLNTTSTHPITPSKKKINDTSIPPTPPSPLLLLPCACVSLVLLGGFLEFQARFPELCEDSSQKCTPLTTQSQPCMPVANVGPTRILPFLYLGSQQDANNRQLLQVCPWQPPSHHTIIALVTFILRPSSSSIPRVP